jgi:branched-chain amino acid transport system substrate-binding protein
MVFDPLPRRRSGIITRRYLARLATGTGLAALAPAIVGRAEPAVIRIGQIEALTGPSSPYGMRARDGAKLALEQINEHGLSVGGSTYRLKVALGDMANDPRQAVTLLRQYAASAEMLCSIGPTNSVGFVPIVPLAEQASFPLVGDGSGVPIKEWNSWGFRVNPINSTGTPILLRQVVAREKVKRLAVLYDQTQDGQRADSEVCKASAATIGYEVVAFEAFRTGDQDFSPQIATIRSAKPDAIFVAAATGDGVKVVTQIREAALDQPLLTGSGSFQDPVYWNGTKGQIKDCYTWISLDLQEPSPALKAFLDAYRKLYGQEPASTCAYGADAIHSVTAALQKAGKLDRAALREVLASLHIVTPIGTHVQFKNPPSGENLDPTVVPIKVTGPGAYDRI